MTVCNSILCMYNMHVPKAKDEKLFVCFLFFNKEKIKTELVLLGIANASVIKH